ncbi:MAG: hypothetical protein Ta2E_00230 [Mycoplasmoidaceae bacterium]|nr:MAG: hypothetical protein Ta2E_00230 [Mycoplasmoidaceae bacterium]
MYDVYDIHNAYIRITVTLTLAFTSNVGYFAAAGDIMKEFICDKRAANFFKQIRKYCNDLLISESLDFIYETNILGATFGEAVKYRNPET